MLGEMRWAWTCVIYRPGNNFFATSLLWSFWLGQPKLALFWAFGLVNYCDLSRLDASSKWLWCLQYQLQQTVFLFQACIVGTWYSIAIKKHQQQQQPQQQQQQQQQQQATAASSNNNNNKSSSNSSNNNKSSSSNSSNNNKSSSSNSNNNNKSSSSNNKNNCHHLHFHCSIMINNVAQPNHNRIPKPSQFSNISVKV